MPGRIDRFLRRRDRDGLRMILETIFQILFLLGAGLIAYVYFGYPAIVLVMSRIGPKPVRKEPIEPTVSLIISAYNEEKALRQKIENTLDLDYPAEKLQIIVASDCSNDSTDSIAGEYSDRGVLLRRQGFRGGKTAVQNLAVERADGEIIVFSDATSSYPRQAVRLLVRNFADPTVGCVAGKLIYVDPSKTDTGSGAISYWNYESFLKSAESSACSLIGVSGCIYAVRRQNYRPMYPEACSDFLIATEIYRQGLRTVFEPDAICHEETNDRSDKEMRMRVRVISQTFTDLWRNRDMLNPLRSGFFAIELISHKVLRYAIPLFLSLVFVSSVVLAAYDRVFLWVFIAQVLFYAAAAGAWLLERGGVRTGPFAIPLYFVLANAASVAGFYQFLRGERYAAWEPIRDTGNIN